MMGNPATHHDLGVNGFGLMPIHSFTSFQGYVVDGLQRNRKRFMAPMKIFKEFIAGAHERGIKYYC